MNEKKKSVFLDRLFGILIVGAIIAIIGGIWWAASSFFGSGNYPLRFRKELDYLLGKDAWECVDKERNRTSVYKKRVRNATTGSRHEEDGDYKKWLIEYTDDNGEIYGLWLNNLTHKVSADKRFFLSPKYVSNRTCFGMNISDFVLNLAAYKLEENVVSGIFEPEEYEYASAKINGTGMDIGIEYPGRLELSYYKRIIDKEKAYNLRDFKVEELLSDPEVPFYISIVIATYEKTEEERKAVDEKAAALKEKLVEEFGELTDLELLIYHFDTGQEYHSMMEEDASRVKYFFVYEGKDIPLTEIREASGENHEPRLEEYIVKRVAGR